MLQKLSKCEVKAWLCWNLIILPPIRFYVKSNFGEFKLFKNVFWVSNVKGSEFWFWYIWATFKSPIYQNSKFRVSKIAKNDIFGLSEFAKIWFHIRGEMIKFQRSQALTSHFVQEHNEGGTACWDCKLGLQVGTASWDWK